MTHHPLLSNLPTLSEDRIQARIDKIQRQIAAASQMANAGVVLPQLYHMLECLKAETSNRIQQQIWAERLQAPKTSWSSDDGIEEIE